MRWVFALALVLLKPLPAEPPQAAPDGHAWLCDTYSGKGDTFVPIRQGETLKWFEGHLADFDSEIAWRVKNESGWTELHAEISSVGKIAGHDVVNMLFRIPTSTKPAAKLVLVGDGRQYRPIIMILTDVEVEFAASRVVTISGTAVLVNRDAITGSGNFYYEDYFVFDRSLDIPVNLQVDRLIHAELQRILPAGRAVRKGGGFHIESLHYTSAVWADGDANCCPAGGKVDIQFAIAGKSLSVKKSCSSGRPNS